VAAAAQDRGDHRQTLTAMARVLGESHALRQACAGPEDQFWRERMLRLLEVERPGQALERELKDAFNAGYADRQRAFEICDARTRDAESATAARGRALAAALKGAAGASGQDAPSDGMAEDARPR
jgi:uncharacterized protein (TIGR02301 family)